MSPAAPGSPPPRCFVVVREPGPGWDAARALTEQDGWAAHAAFMNGLVDDGFVVLGGPLGDRGRALLVVRATDREAVRSRLAADPWTDLGILRLATVDPWTLLLGDLPAPLGRRP